jgi:ABC-type branched-subunit amino acid transport system ATPase component
MKVCSRIHVLDFGRIISVGTPREVQADPHVQAAYLGAEEPAEEVA